MVDLQGKIRLKWMIWGTPIPGNHHMGIKGGALPEDPPGEMWG